MWGQTHVGLGCTFLLRGRRGLACAVLAFGAVLAAPAAGLGDAAPIPSSARSVDQLASRIATDIAGKTVTVRCDSAARRAVVVDPRGVTLASELCWPLQEFAQANFKPTKCVKRSVAAPVPCYLGHGRTVARKSPAYWAAYDLTATAIFKLARAATKTNCAGMQWMPFVAEQLGDTPADAQAIARYALENVVRPARSAVCLTSS
jgi:hypothetical protein